MSHEHVDVLIIGAGLSGIGAACHLQAECPQKSYAILESRDAIGGTWDLFKYPGIRSDSDMYTLAYSFRPWDDDKAIVEGPSILDYVRETARDNSIDSQIRFGHRVVSADWSSADAHWTVEATREDTREPVRMTCDFLFMCTGYYSYDDGYTPDFAGIDSFAGEIVHPQLWRADTEHAGKRVIVIGSGATAITLVPALAESAEHVTMLQRSPTYVISLPAEDPFAKLARRLLPTDAAHAAVRWKNVAAATLVFQLSRRAPGLVKRLLRAAARRKLPPDYDFDKHFNPRYAPWDERMCVLPDSDLFDALSSGRASIVTDHIDTFTRDGVRLRSGQQLQADLIVTATGLNPRILGDTQLSVDGRHVDPAQTITYKGIMLSGVPNLAMSFGYINASWTLKCDLTCGYVCRLLNHMDEHGYRECMPASDMPAGAGEPFIDLSSGYVQRLNSLFPKQGSSAPWRANQNHVLDRISLKRSDIDDGALRFSNSRASTASSAEPLAAVSLRS